MVTMLIIPVYAEEIAEELNHTALGTAELSLATLSDGSNLVFDADIESYDKASNRVIADKSESGLTVEITGEPASGKETNGTEEISYIEFNSTEMANFRVQSNKITGQDNTTVELWAKPNITDDAGRVLFSFSQSTKANSTFNATLTTDTMTVFLNGQTAQCDIADYMNKWSHYVFVRSYETGKAALKVYIDSKEVINTEFEGVAKADESSCYFYVATYGTRKASQLPTIYTGAISEARIYNSALSFSDVKLNYLTQCELYRTEDEGGEDPENPPVDPEDPEDPTTELSESENGAVFDLKISDGLTDISGNSFNVTAEGGAEIADFVGVDGTVKYVKFSDETKNQYLKIQDSRLLNLPDLTVELRMQMPPFKSIYDEATNKTVNFYPKFFSISTGGGDRSMWIETGPNDNGYIYLANANKGGNLIGDMRSKVAPGEWVHITMTRTWNKLTRQTVMELYFNGTSISRKLYTEQDAPGDHANASFFAGGSEYNGILDIYTGGISEYRIYNKVLNSDVIYKKYEDGLSAYAIRQFEPVVEGKIKRTSSSVSYKMINDVSIASDITVTDLINGNPFKATVTKTENGFDLIFNQYLKYGQRLKIYSASLDSYVVAELEEGNTAASLDIYDGNDKKVTALNGSEYYSINVKVTNNGATAKSYKYMLVGKNEKGATLSTASGIINVENGNSGNRLNVLDNMKDAKELKLYLWELENGMMIPVYKMPVTVK